MSGIFICRKVRQVHDNAAVGGREDEDTLDQRQRVDRRCDSGSEWHLVRNSENRGKTCCIPTGKPRCADPVTLRLTTAVILSWQDSCFCSFCLFCVF